MEESYRKILIEVIEGYLVPKLRALEGEISRTREITPDIAREKVRQAQARGEEVGEILSGIDREASLGNRYHLFARPRGWREAVTYLKSKGWRVRKVVWCDCELFCLSTDPEAKHHAGEDEIVRSTSLLQRDDPNPREYEYHVVDW